MTSKLRRNIGKVEQVLFPANVMRTSFLRALQAAKDRFTLTNGLGDATGPNGEFAFNKFGENLNITGTSTETIWSASNLYTYPASALTMTLTSAAGATDDGVTVRVVYLNSDWEDTRATLTLNNASPPTFSARRINRMFVNNATASTGLITAANGGTTYAEIPVAHQQTEAAVATVPANHTAFITSIHMTLGRGDQADLALMTRAEGSVFRTRLNWNSLYEANFQHVVAPPDQYIYGIRCPEKTDIELQATRIASTGASITPSAGFQVVVVPGT